MKAVVFNKYGPPEVLQIQDVEKPVPKDNEVLVKIHATTVTIGDVIVRSGKHPDSRFYSIMLHFVFGLIKPRRPVLVFRVVLLTFFRAGWFITTKVSNYKLRQIFSLFY